MPQRAVRAEITFIAIAPKYFVTIPNRIVIKYFTHPRILQRGKVAHVLTDTMLTTIIGATHTTASSTIEPITAGTLACTAVTYPHITTFYFTMSSVDGTSLVVPSIVGWASSFGTISA
jgi:hypothetical protein